MARSRTTREIVKEIRSLLDEDNLAELSDDSDVVPAMNRALDFATDILSRQYPSALLATAVFMPTAGENTYPIPEDAYSEKLEKVEVFQGGYPKEVRRIDYRDSTLWKGPASGIPLYYYVSGSDVILLPTPSGVSSIQFTYVREAGPLVAEHGRITALNVGQNYLLLAEILDTDDLSTDIESEQSYVNVCDGRTGAIRCTLQVSSIDNSRVSFRSTPTQTTVQGRVVAGSLPATVQRGDYLCPVDGTCIPPLRNPVTNFLIGSAVADIQAVKFGGDPGVVLSLKDKFEEQVKRTWAGRETSLRVKQKSTAWAPSRSHFVVRLR